MARQMVHLACGCSAAATHANAHDGLPAGHPSCFIHDCCTVAEAPNLTGRMARCGYYHPERTDGHKWQPARDVGPIYGGGDKSGLCDNKAGSGCRCEVPSNAALPFFQSHPEKPMDTFYCGCRGWD